jgi:hypothetical protein
MTTCAASGSASYDPEACRGGRRFEMYTLDALREDIRAVVAYNIADEEHDYQVQQDEGNEEGSDAHIVHVLRRLDAFATGDEA